MKMHIRAPAGLRLEETEKVVERAEHLISKSIPADELASVTSNVGVPTSFNLAFVPSENVGSMDAEILVALKPEHQPIQSYMRKIRAAVHRDLPEVSLQFLPADIVSQVINFGVLSPIDIQMEGPDVTKTFPYARRLREAIRRIPGAVDVNIRQVLDYPTVKLNVDRERAARVGLQQNDVASSMLIALSSSSTVAPVFLYQSKQQR